MTNFQQRLRDLKKSYWFLSNKTCPRNWSKPRVFNKNIFGQRLRLLRKAKNLSLKEVADSIGSFKSTIGNLERGIKAPSIDMLITLADFFDVSLDYLVGRSDDPWCYRPSK